MNSADYDPLNPSATEASRKAKRDAAWFEERDAADDLKRLMSCRWGRRFMWGLLNRAGVWRLSFSTNAMQMAFAEGRKNEGLAMMAAIHKLCPDRWTEMLKEQKQHDDRSTSDDRNNAN